MNQSAFLNRVNYFWAEYKHLKGRKFKDSVICEILAASAVGEAWKAIIVYVYHNQPYTYPH